LRKQIDLVSCCKQASVSINQHFDARPLVTSCSGPTVSDFRQDKFIAVAAAAVCRRAQQQQRTLLTRNVSAPSSPVSSATTHFLASL
jgi:hypothetical protein